MLRHLRRHRTGFEETKDFPIRMNDLIAGRYQVMDFLGSAAFSRAVQALDTKTGMLVCLKIIKVTHCMCNNLELLAMSGTCMNVFVDHFLCLGAQAQCNC